MERLERVLGWMDNPGDGVDAKRPTDRLHAWEPELFGECFSIKELATICNFDPRSLTKWIKESPVRAPVAAFPILCDAKGEVVRLEDGTRFAIIERGGKGRGKATLLRRVLEGGKGLVAFIPSYVTN